MVTTMWISFGLIIYFVCFATLKLYLHNKGKSRLVNDLCEFIEKNDTVSCLKTLERNLTIINTFTKSGYTPFMVACANGNTQIVKLMLKAGADVRLKSLNKESPFYLATFYYIKYPYIRNASCLRELFYAGADIDESNDKGLTPLQMAAMFGHTALAKWLLLKRASVDVLPNPFVIATSQGHQDTAALIWKMTRGFSLEFKI